MKVTKTEIRFKTGFQQPKTGLPKKPVLTSLYYSHTILNSMNIHRPMLVTIISSFSYLYLFYNPCAPVELVRCAPRCHSTQVGKHRIR